MKKILTTLCLTNPARAHQLSKKRYVQMSPIFFILTLSALLTCFVPCQSVRGNLIVNGSFETPVVTAPSGFETETLIPGWVIASQVILFNSTHAPVDSLPDGGLQSAEFNTQGQSISQPFATSIGTRYNVSFDLSSLNASLSILGVSVTGSGITDFTGLIGGYSGHQFAFTAVSNFTALSFFDDSGALQGDPLFDNVVVDALPSVPDAGSTLGLLALALTALFGGRRLRSLRLA